MDHQTIPVNSTYKKKMPILWWTRRFSSIRFIIRELTSLAVAFFAVELLFLVRALSRGPEAYAEFMQTLRLPVWIALHIVALAALVFHSITWFNLAPKAMVLKAGEKPIPGAWIAAANYAGWIVISAVIAWLLISASP